VLSLALTAPKDEALDPARGVLQFQALWITDCEISDLAGVAGLLRLRDLALPGNKLTSLRSLPALPSLTNLDLARNAMNTLDADALARVPQLKHLSVAHNRLDFPGRDCRTALCNTTTALLNLTSLNCAGNPAGSLRDASAFAVLPALRSLHFEDVHGSCPIVALRHYRTAVLSSLPKLTSLDGMDVREHDSAGEDAMRHVSWLTACRTGIKALQRTADDVRAYVAAAVHAARAHALHLAGDAHRAHADIEALEWRCADGGGGGQAAAARMGQLESFRNAAMRCASQLDVEHVAAWRQAWIAMQRHADAVTSHSVICAGNVFFEHEDDAASGGHCDAPSWRDFCALLAGRCCEGGTEQTQLLRLVHAARIRNRHLGATFKQASHRVAVAMAESAAAAVTAPVWAGQLAGIDDDGAADEDGYDAAAGAHVDLTTELGGSVQEDEDGQRYEEISDANSSSDSSSDFLDDGSDDVAQDSDDDDTSGLLSLDDGPQHDQTPTITRMLLSRGTGSSSEHVWLFYARAPSAVVGDDDTLAVHRVAEEGFSRFQAASGHIILHSSPEAALRHAGMWPPVQGSDGAAEVLVLRVCPGVVVAPAPDEKMPPQLGTCDAVLRAVGPRSDDDDDSVHTSYTYSCFTPALALPEYILHLETESVDGDAVDAVWQQCVAVPPSAQPLLRPLSALLVRARRRSEALTIEAATLHMNAQASQPSVPRPLHASSIIRSQTLRVLSLHAVGLRGDDLAGLQLGTATPMLERLVLSCNALTSLAGCHTLSRLTQLVACDNALSHLESDVLSALGQTLSSLDLARNPLPAVEDLVCLCSLPALTELCLSGAELTRDEGLYRGLVLRRAPQLRCLDGGNVTPEQVAAASAQSSALTPTLLAAGACTAAGMRVAPDSEVWFTVARIDIPFSGLRRLDGMPRLDNLESAQLAGNAVSEDEVARALGPCSGLAQLDLSYAALASLTPLVASCPSLTCLHADGNVQLGASLTSPMEWLPWRTLTVLSLERCGLTSLMAFGPSSQERETAIQPLSALRELYLGNNLVAGLTEVAHLAGLRKLASLQLAGNPMCVSSCHRTAHGDEENSNGSSSSYRLFVVHALPHISALDGVPISPREAAAAASAFSAGLTHAVLNASLVATDTGALMACNLAGKQLRHLGDCNSPLLAVGHDLRSITLDGNPALRSLQPLQVLQRLNSVSAAGCSLGISTAPPSADTTSPFFPALTRLDVSNNALRHLAGLQLQPMPALRVLHLDRNVGLGATLEQQQQQQQQHSRRRKSASVPAVIGAPIALPQLIELSLQCCAIGGLPRSFLAGLPSLRTLRLSNNRLRSLAPWTTHHSLLTHLHVGGNRLSDLDETLALLPRLDGLQELVLSGNAVARAPQYRISITVACGGELQRLDGVQISDAEIDAAAAMLSAGTGKKAAVAAVKASISKDNSHQAAPSAPPLLRAPLGGDTKYSLAPAVSSTPSLMDVTADVSAEALDEALLQLHVPSKVPTLATRVASVQQLGLQQQLLPPLPGPAPQKQRRVEKRSIANPPRLNLANAPLGLTISGIGMAVHSATKKDSTRR